MAIINLSKEADLDKHIEDFNAGAAGAPNEPGVRLVKHVVKTCQAIRVSPEVALIWPGLSEEAKQAAVNEYIKAGRVVREVQN